jgi:hypothetical protein
MVGASSATQIFVRAWPGTRGATINQKNEATRAGGLATHKRLRVFRRRPCGRGQSRHGLICDLDDVPPHCLDGLLTLGRKIIPGFGVVECLRLCQAVPLGNGHTLGSRTPLH